MKKQIQTRVLNCIPSKGTENDWLYEDALAAFFTKKVVKIPASVDLRDNTWWKINDQGHTGSCVGWATAEGVLRWCFVNKKAIQPTEPLSVRFIWMSAKETDLFTSRPTTFIEESGTSIKTALDIARKYGCVLDGQLPFHSSQLYTGSEREFYAQASRLRIVNYINLVEGSNNKLDSWKHWIAAGNGPILTRLNVDSTWYKATANKGNLDKYDTKTAGGGHAVAIVGYLKDRFIIRNSWGEDWGDKGFGYASPDYAKVAFTEAYGVNV